METDQREIFRIAQNDRRFESPAIWYQLEGEEVGGSGGMALPRGKRRVESPGKEQGLTNASLSETVFRAEPFLKGLTTPALAARRGSLPAASKPPIRRTCSKQSPDHYFSDHAQGPSSYTRRRAQTRTSGKIH